MARFTRTIAEHADQWVNVDHIEMVRTDTNSSGRWCVKAEVGLNKRIVTLCPYQDCRHDFDSREEAAEAALHVMQQMGGVVGFEPCRQPVYERDLPGEKPEGRTFGHRFKEALGSRKDA